MGLNEEITRAGYKPDTIGPKRITDIKIIHISIVFILIALPVRILRYGIVTNTTTNANIDAIILITKDSIRNCFIR
jgi:hypothetical protein